MLNKYNPDSLASYHNNTCCRCANPRQAYQLVGRSPGFALLDTVAMLYDTTPIQHACTHHEESYAPHMLAGQYRV